MAWLEKVKAFFGLEWNIQILVFSSLIGTTGFQFWHPFLPLYVRFLGASMEQLGFVFSMQLLANIIMGVVSGVLADRVGRKRCILMGNTLGATNFIIMGLARSWVDLIPLLLVDTVSGALIRPGMWAMMAESIPDEKRATGFATAMVIPSFAFVVGPAVGGYISEVHGYRILFFAGAILQYIMIAIRVKYLKETLVKQEIPSPSRSPSFSLRTFKETLRELSSLYRAVPSLKALLVISCFDSFAGNVASSYYVVFMENVIKLSRFEIGSLLSLSQLASILFTIPSGKLADRFGRRPCILFGWVTTIPLGLAFLFAKDAFQATIISASTSLLGSLTGPAWSALTAEVTPKEKRATIMGTLGTLGSACGISGPTIGAYLWQNYSPRLPFYASIVLGLPALIIFTLYLKPPASVQQKDNQHA